MSYGIFRAGSVGEAALASNAVTSAKIKALEVATGDIAAEAITQAKIAADAVGADQLASNAVVNASVASGAAIALSKLAGGSEAQIIVHNSSGEPAAVALSGDATIAASGALTIAADAVNSAEIADGAIDTAHIADDQVTNAKLANITRGSIKVGGASNAPTDLDAKGNGKILVGDGTDVASVAVSGDATLASTGALTVTGASGDFTVTGSLTVNGDTTTVSTTNMVVEDLLVELGNGVTGAPGNDAGIVIERGTADNAFMGWDESADKFLMGTGSFTGASTGNLTVATGTLVANIEGNVTGALTGNVTGNVTGDLTGDVTGDVTGDLTGTASLATQITVSANNSTDETVYPLFVDGATGSQGAETDTSLSYNPSSGLLTSTGFAGNFSGNLVGNVTGDVKNGSGATLVDVSAGTAELDLTGAVTAKLSAHTVAGNISASHDCFFLAANATIPSARCSAGARLLFHALADNASAMEISTQSTEKIDNDSGAFSMPAGASVMLISDGTDWMVF